MHSGTVPPVPDSLASLTREFLALDNFRKSNPAHKALETDSGNLVVYPDMLALLQFLFPSGTRSGPAMLASAKAYHSAAAGDFIGSMLKALDERKTIILDLSNANPTLVDFFSEKAAQAVYDHRMKLNVVHRRLRPALF
ncbi:MAG: hypothetical protein ACOX8N_03375 [Christensenellales bacterium]|jgi:hypothetical protein